MRNRGQQDRETTEDLQNDAHTKRSFANPANTVANESDQKYQARMNEKERETQKNQAYDKQLQQQENQKKMFNIMQGAVIGVLVLAFFYLVNEQLFGRSPESTPK